MDRGQNRNEAALVVVDVQNDFCPGGALAVPEGDAIVDRVNRLLKAFPARILTQDWHPPGHASFAESHPGAKPYDTVEAFYGAQILWPTHCVQGTAGAAFHQGLRMDAADIVVRKGFRKEVDSYSAFHENDKKTKTGLAGYLRDRGIEKVVFAGLALDFCVYYSAMDAIKEGFEATVLEDCCRAIDLDGSLEAARSDMSDSGVRFADSSEFL